jgi:hypothetical protein
MSTDMDMLLGSQVFSLFTSIGYCLSSMIYFTLY